MEQIDNSLKEPEEEQIEVPGSEEVSDTKVEDDGQTSEDQTRPKSRSQSRKLCSDTNSTKE